MSQELPLELWGGIECTVARIDDTWRDQSRETGHGDRIEDLDAVAGLGIRTLRYPVLWETVSPEHPDRADWAWHDARLQRLRELGIRPIAGLLHHGSGPHYTSLLDPNFPELFARHAARVAERYPWIDLYTPVNEPLTTARFSALYGHWYPHQRSYPAFLRALVNQCRATVLAMRAIRRIRPDAQLVQTDDLGKTFAVPRLAYQAEHENDRRWITFDLLCGRVDRQHPMWSFLADWARIDEADLALFREGDAAPDIIGINHYLTSERFLDDRRDCYPPELIGGNGRHRYADVEAVRVADLADDVGPAARLREVWQRYRRPVAVTEVHHGCTRDEQVRWLVEVWNAARAVKAEGADIRAVTVWSLFGTVDWNSLLVRKDGVYEAGAFDIRGARPRPTAIARAAAGLARSGAHDHPVLDRPGWWARDDRFYEPPRDSGNRRVRPRSRPLLICGTGPLAEAFGRACGIRGLDHLGPFAPIGERADALIERHRPWAVIDARTSPDEEGRSSMAAGSLARASAAAQMPFVMISSERVFDGRPGGLYAESDAVGDAPEASVQARREQDVRVAHPAALVVRTGPLFGPWAGDTLVPELLRRVAAAGASAADIVSPTYVPDLVHVVLDLLVDGEEGLWHLPNPGAMSWLDFARATIGLEGGEMLSRASAPGSNRALTSKRGLLLPPLASAMERYRRDCALHWPEGGATLLAAE